MSWRLESSRSTMESWSSWWKPTARCRCDDAMGEMNWCDSVWTAYWTCKCESPAMKLCDLHVVGQVAFKKWNVLQHTSSPRRVLVGFGKQISCRYRCSCHVDLTWFILIVYRAWMRMIQFNEAFNGACRLAARDKTSEYVHGLIESQRLSKASIFAKLGSISLWGLFSIAHVYFSWTASTVMSYVQDVASGNSASRYSK